VRKDVEGERSMEWRNVEEDEEGEEEKAKKKCDIRTCTGGRPPPIFLQY
jgi:hypothetical protein